MVEVILWSDRNLKEHITDETKKLAMRIKLDKEAFVKAMLARLGSS